MPVYPRVCGGTARSRSCSPWRSGLSPRVRGNHERPTIDPKVLRSIPRVCGGPTGLPTAATMATVYPRVCGGTLGDDGIESIAKGLSPRVRGNHESRGRARAGRVYPRVCGGTGGRRQYRSAAAGLSPRVRGNLAFSLDIP